MHTTHEIRFGNAADLSFLSDNSIPLVVTSPPYPMIEMWDNLFSGMNNDIHDALARLDGRTAFELMHVNLDLIWRELYRVLRPGGIVCINIGDATRTLGVRFRLYSNHARILSACQNIGFEVLPCIIWRKPTNAPNKFMGSGMLPAGAYVTLEHEYILILRKDGKREFRTEDEKRKRRESAIFREERNRWYSDIWEIKGVSQNIRSSPSRVRSAAYPFELAYRLILMHSVIGDTVLDPFLGTGVTTIAAMATGRNSIGVEIDLQLEPLIRQNILSVKPMANARVYRRVQDHVEYSSRYLEEKVEIRYRNTFYGFPVVTRQERDIRFHTMDSAEYSVADQGYIVNYDVLERQCWMETKPPGSSILTLFPCGESEIDAQ